MPLSPTVVHFARDHHGLVTLSAWRAAGHARSSFHDAVRSGVLQPVACGVAALPGTSLGPLHDIAAAVLRFGPDVIVSHVSAAWLWGAPVEPGRRVELITTRRDQRTSDDRVTIHRPDDRRRVRAAKVHDLAVTAPVRTLLDLGATDASSVMPALEALVRSGATTVPAVRHGLRQRRRRGRPGTVALERALEELGGVVTDSDLETAMRRLFRSEGLTGWTFHERIEGFEVDFCFRRERVVVEVDGWAFHGAQRSSWERDLERDSLLAARGWQVVRLTWRMVTRRPDQCAARLREVLRQRR